ncbi:acyl-CoA dehydrogenase family protein [Streptomyces sp. NPDC005921]
MRARPSRAAAGRSRPAFLASPTAHPWGGAMEGRSTSRSPMRHLHVRRRLSEQLDGVSHGPEGSLDKLLMTWTEQTVGHAALAVGGTDDPELLHTYLYSRAQSVMGGTSQIQKNIIASRILGLGA